VFACNKKTKHCSQRVPIVGTVGYYIGSYWRLFFKQLYSFQNLKNKKAAYLTSGVADKGPATPLFAHEYITDLLINKRKYKVATTKWKYYAKFRDWHLCRIGSNRPIILFDMCLMVQKTGHVTCTELFLITQPLM